MIKCTKILLILTFIFGGIIVYGQSREKDSLRNPFSQYFLTDIELREVAQLIVKDSIQPSDNNITFSILDSIVNGNQETRNYYEDAFDLIIIKSDGALSEVIGQYCINSIYKNANELLNWLSNGKMESTPETIAGYIAYELVMSEEPEKEKQNLIMRLKHDAKNTSIIQYSNKFINLIEDAFKHRLEE